MSRFSFGSKKNTEKHQTVCSCTGDCCASTAEEQPNACCAGTESSICSIKVLGAGCKSCRELYENTQKAVNAMGLSAKTEYITDMQKVMEYGVMSMPALVVNEKVVSMGKVLKVDAIEELLKKLGFSQ